MTIYLPLNQSVHVSIQVVLIVWILLEFKDLRKRHLLMRNSLFNSKKNNNYLNQE